MKALSAMTQQSGAIDQQMLRMYLNLASSYLVTDSTTNPDGGIGSWKLGFNRLVDVMVALHQRSELELETVNAASQACSECWSTAGSIRGLEDCREDIRQIAGKLKTILDPNGRTYGGERVYAP